VARLAEFVAAHAVGVLNVAGPRASGAPAAHRYAYDLLDRYLA
jgi:hypothetical protein